MSNDHEELRTVVSHAVKETLIQLGFDVNDPKRLQADMAHLRYWRETLEQITSNSIIGAVVFIIGSMLTLLWVGFQTLLGKS